MLPSRVLVIVSFVVAASKSGCWSQVEQYCPRCPTVEHTQVTIPPPGPGTHTEVVLVHGAFGFGEEWTPIVTALRQSPGVAFFAWTWPGPQPFANPPRDAQVLASELQALLDQLPAAVEELLVLAHSGGAVLTNFAARQLRVPPGRHVTVALLDPALWPILALWPALAAPASYPPVPAGVTMTVYFAALPPPLAARPLPPDPTRTTDLPQEYVGNVGHNPIVAKVALPLLAARRRR